jgi:hypothetical protein
MDVPSLACTKCNAPLPLESFAGSPRVQCASCGIFLTAYWFPALSHPTLVTQSPESLLTDSEASCFFHPAKKAVVACESCGRFLCGLCDLDWEGRHICATCLETGKKKGKIKALQNSRVLYDQIALATALVPLLLLFTWILTCVTAPLAIFLSVRYWNAPSSLAQRTKIRFILAILLGLAQIGGWIWMIAEIVHNSRH